MDRKDGIGGGERRMGGLRTRLSEAILDAAERSVGLTPAVYASWVDGWLDRIGQEGREAGQDWSGREGRLLDRIGGEGRIA